MPGLLQAVEVKDHEKLDDGLVGRICKKYSSGFCCVKFAGDLGCLRIHEKFLVATTKKAPLCDEECAAGCWGG